MQEITSAQNPAVKAAKALKERKTRMAEGVFLVEGEVMIREAVSCGLSPVTVFARKELADTAASFGVRDTYIVPEHLLSQICDTQTPQGICAVVPLPKSVPLASLPDRIVALDGVQDPGNVGTIWRTADAAGFGAVLLGKGTADPYSPKVQRASMGSGFRLRQHSADDLSTALRELKARGYRVIASLLDGDPFFQRGDIGGKYVLVIGNEAKGISAPVRAEADVKLKLPMYGGAESLNAAVAAAIMMYDLVRYDAEHGRISP